MIKDYVICVDFRKNIDGRTPISQALNVHWGWPEFAILIEALNG